MMSRTSSAKLSGQKTPIGKPPVSKTPNPTVKPASRNGLLPPMTQIKYSIDIDVLKCPVCLEVFKSPRVLSCGHSVCLECLYTNIVFSDSSKTKDTFQCTVCWKNIKPRDPGALREKWATQFPVNSVIVRLLKNATIKNLYDDGWHKAFCEICLSNNTTKPAVSYCNSCLEHQYTVCAKHHEKREETKDHEIVSFLPKEENVDKKEQGKHDWNKKGRQAEDLPDRKVKIFDPVTKESRLTPIPATVVSQTVTASDTMREKHIVRLGSFLGKAKGDTDISDFKGATFLTDHRLVLVDCANKKVKVFDVSHKSRVDLISDITLRADPSHTCRVDANTFGVVIERSGTYHVRLFTVRDKIYHFVHRVIEGVPPLGLGFIHNTVICSFLGENSLRKYRLSKAQQIALGIIKEDRTGNDIFHHPGAMCTGKWKETQVVYVADETDFGVTVIAVDVRGEKKTSVFFEFPVTKSKSPGKKSNGNWVPKTGRNARGRLSSKKDDASDTTNESEMHSDRTTNKKSTKKEAEQRKEVRVSGRHTFRRVDEYGRPESERHKGREIERPPLSSVTQAELVIDLDKLTQDSDERASLDKTLPLRSRREGKAVERARKKPVGKVAPQLNGTIPTDRQQTRNNDAVNGNSTFNMEGTIKTNNATNGANSTGSSLVFAVPPKLVYRADSLAVDNNGNIYMCISSMNKIHQMSPDGRVKREILTDKDGLVDPKIVCFSPSNDVIIVTCKKSNKVHMFKMKEQVKAISSK